MIYTKVLIQCDKCIYFIISLIAMNRRWNVLENFSKCFETKSFIFCNEGKLRNFRNFTKEENWAMKRYSKF